MTILRGVITQGGADTFTSQSIDTQLSADGKAGWQINALKCYWSNGYTAAAADAIANLVLATISTATLPNDAREIARVSWAVQNTAGVAVAFNFEPIKMAVILEPRITVQPLIYIQANTTSTGLTNVMYWELDYEIVKLADLEVLRLLVGGT